MPSSSTNTYFRCIVCKSNHRPWECRVFKEKTPNQRAKLVADNKLCFSCLWDKHIFRQCFSQKSAEKKGVIVRVTHYRMEQIGFFQKTVCEILEYTSVDQWNHLATKDNPADAGTRGMFAEDLQLSSRVKGPHFLTISRFLFVPNKDVIKNIKLGVNLAVAIEDTVSLTTSVKKQITSVPSIFPFDKFSSYQKFLRIASYVLRHLPQHAGYRNLDGSITDPKQSLLKPKGKILTIILLNGAAELLHVHRLSVQTD